MTRNRKTKHKQDTHTYAEALTDLENLATIYGAALHKQWQQLEVFNLQHHPAAQRLENIIHHWAKYKELTLCETPQQTWHSHYFAWLADVYKTWNEPEGTAKQFKNWYHKELHDSIARTIETP